MQKRMSEIESNAVMQGQPPAIMLAQQQEAQAQAQAQGGQPPPGAGPQPAGAAMPATVGPQTANATIESIMSQAEQIAQELLTSDPLTRRQRLGELKNQDETLYAQTKAKLAELEQQAKTMGVQAARAGQM